LLDVTIVHPPWVYGEGDGLSFPKWSKVSRAAIWSFSETVVAILLKLTMSGILPRRWNNIMYDTSKLKALGFKQGYTFEEGITG
jgi:nucleoside-diphosphate-sugar epimerase